MASVAADAARALFLTSLRQQASSWCAGGSGGGRPAPSPALILDIGCNNIGMQFGSESWGVAQNWGSSLCGLSTTSYTSATSYIGGYDWIISRSGSTDTIRVGTLEGIASCTIGDNPGSAYIDIWVRN